MKWRGLDIFWIVNSGENTIPCSIKGGGLINPLITPRSDSMKPNPYEETTLRTTSKQTRKNSAVFDR